MAALPVLECNAQVFALVSTSGTLAAEVSIALQDTSYTEAMIIEQFNGCLMELAGEMLIPDLETWADIETRPRESRVNIPADFMKNLRYCHSVSFNRQVKVYGSLPQIYRLLSKLDQAGQVVGVCRQGRYFYYQRVPASSETLRINYFKYPERLALSTDKPSCIPWHLAKPLLKFFALKNLYAEIEDGIEGPQLNTQRYEAKYNFAKEELWKFIGPEQREPVWHENEIDWEAYA